MIIPDTLIDRISLLPVPYIVVVSGFGGAGKSTFASALGRVIDAPVIGVDSFITDRTRNDYGCWDLMDLARLKTEVLVPFLERKPVRYGHYEWETNAIVEVRDLPSTRGVIVEGIGLLQPVLLGCFSLSIWLKCPIEKAIARGMERDREEYRSPQDEAWQGIWKRNDEEFYAAFEPMKAAHVIIDNAKSNIAEPEN